MAPPRSCSVGITHRIAEIVGSSADDTRRPPPSGPSNATAIPRDYTPRLSLLLGISAGRAAKLLDMLNRNGAARRPRGGGWCAPDAGGGERNAAFTLCLIREPVTVEDA